MATDFPGAVLARLLELVSAQGVVNPVGRAFTATGEVVWDDCCKGQLWVRLVSMDPLILDQRRGAQEKCGPDGWMLTIGVGILRCAATVNDQGVVPSVSQLVAESKVTTAEAQALRAAITCVDLSDETENLALRRQLLTSWSPLGPEGGCVGGEWTMTVPVTDCGCD